MCVRVCECVCVFVYIHMRALLFFIEMTIYTTNFKKQQSPGHPAPIMGARDIKKVITKREN